MAELSILDMPISTETLAHLMIAERDKQQRLHDMYERKARNCHPLEAHRFRVKRLIAKGRIEALAKAIEALAEVEADADL